jgi:DNA adenine methylase
MMDNNLLALFNSLEDSTEKRNRYERPPFSYAGCKYKSLEHILPNLPYRRVWVDVFGGSGVVTLNRERSVLDVFNDRYAGLVAFYRVIRDAEKLKQLVQRLDLTINSREEYIWCKETWENCQDDVERAARWYYALESSVVSQMDAYARTVNCPMASNIREYIKKFDLIHSRFKTVQVENLDFRTCMRDYDSKDTVFYCDPPYFETHSGAYKQAGAFKREDHECLLAIIHSCTGFVALSGFPTDFYENYNWDHRYEWDCYTSTALGTGCNRPTKEVLWIKE